MLRQRHNYKKTGFTLIELLVAIGVFLAVGTIIGLILSASLRSSNKASTITNVRQNGSYALAQMAKMIRSAQRWDASAGDGVSTNDTDYVVDCSTNPPGTAYHYLKATSSLGNQTKFVCVGPTDSIAITPTPTPGLAWIGASINGSLIDTNAVALSGSCTITCQMTSLTDDPLISISFSLLQKNQSSFVENIVSPNAIPFETSVAIRNGSK